MRAAAMSRLISAIGLLGGIFWFALNRDPFWPGVALVHRRQARCRLLVASPEDASRTAGRLLVVSNEPRVYRPRAAADDQSASRRSTASARSMSPRRSHTLAA